MKHSYTQKETAGHRVFLVSVDEIRAGLSKLAYGLIWPSDEPFPEIPKVRVRPQLLCKMVLETE